MDISIIVLSFNTKDLTIKAIKSVINDKSTLKKELIIVDNGSTDGSTDAFKKINPQDCKLVIIENGRNLGFAKANNQGLKKSSGQFKLLLNSDTELRRGLIDKLVEFAQSKADCGAVVPKLLNADGSSQGSVYYFPSILRAVAHFWFGRKKYFDKYVPSGNNAVTIESAVMAAFLLTPAALKKVGYLDERYFMYFEDMDYCKRIRDVGLKVYYLPTAEVLHHHGASGKKLADTQNQWKRLIPSSRIYHGFIKHYVIYFIIRISQLWKKLRSF